MVKGFVLPERLPGVAHAGVGGAGRDSLDSAGDSPQRQAGLDQEMNVIGHDDICVQRVVVQCGASSDSVFG
jgi:hypothetical protein